MLMWDFTVSSDRFFFTTRNFSNSLVLIRAVVSSFVLLEAPLSEKPALVEGDERGT